MATYRPKSLNEINSSYDKSIASQNTIKDTESTITTAADKDMASTIEAIHAAPARKEKKPIGDLSADIQTFIRDFGNPVKQAERPAPRTTQIKPAAAQKPAVKPEAAPAPELKAQENQTERAEFVMTAEKSELFEEYMRIMSDEDDDSYFSKSKSRKKKKSRKGDETALADAFVEEAEKEEAPSAEAYDSRPEEAYESFTAPEYSSDLSEIENEPEAPEQDVYSQEEYYEEEVPVKEKKKNVFLQLFLILLLLVTLIAALGTTVLNVVLKVDSGESFADKYYFYTVDKNDSVLNLTKGDLVVAIDSKPVDNDIVAYYNSNMKAFDFAVKRSEVSEEVILAENESTNGQINIFSTNIRGKLIKIYPVIGTAVGAVCDNFIVVIAALLALALVLILILAFAFGRSSKKAGKDNFSFDDEEDDDYPYAEFEIKE